MTDKKIEKIKGAKDEICRLYDTVHNQCNGKERHMVIEVNLEDLTKACGFILECFMKLDDEGFEQRCLEQYRKLQKSIDRLLIEMKN